MYWLDKFNLFKRSSLYFAGNLSISSHALKMLQFSLLVLSAATFFFASQSEGKLDLSRKVVNGVKSILFIEVWHVSQSLCPTSL